MKNVFVFGLLCAALCFSGIPAMAATHGSHATPDIGSHAPQARSARKAPPLKEMGGQEVSNDYFKLVIPAGWSMPKPASNVPGKGLNVLFASMDKNPAVNISVMQSPASAKQIAELTVANMKKGGIATSPLEEKDGLWHATLSGKGKGEVWFGANDGVAAVTIIAGDNVEKANEILSALDAKVKGIFPKAAR